MSNKPLTWKDMKELRFPNYPGTIPMAFVNTLEVKYKDNKRVINTLDVLKENYALHEKVEAMHEELHEIYRQYATGDEEITCEFCKEDN